MTSPQRAPGRIRAPDASRDRRSALRRVAALVLGSLAVILLVALAAPDALARIGGGQSYGGGGGGGGGGDGGGEGLVILVRLLLWLCIAHPTVGVPLTAVVVVVGIVYYRKQERTGGFASRAGSGTALVPSRGIAKAQVDQLRQRDPNFSTPLFLDFIQLLFVRIHEARGKGDYEALRPYAGESVFAALPRLAGLEAVDEVVVGAARIQGASVSTSRVWIRVEIEANYTERVKGSPARRIYTMERWRLGRKGDVLSKGPGDIATLACPNCASPVELDPSGTCRSCGQKVTNGAFHWQIESIGVVDRRAPLPVELTHGGGREVGLDRPTVFAPGFDAARKAFALRYPEFSWQEFEGKVREAFFKLNEAWSGKTWEKARPFETDHLFDTHRYWIEQYKEGGLSNRTEKIEILKVIPVKIEQDAFFEAIAVRIHARMIDYTVEDKTGKIVGGSTSSPREFSEYWTFIRRSGFDPKKKGEADACPSCGAPLKISMTGICEFCNSRVTTGEFDWVLSAIDQDEAYEG